MVKKVLFILIILIIGRSGYCQKNIPGNSLFTEILSEYVKNGLVDYKNLKNDSRLNEYIDQLSKTDPNDFKNIDDIKAFWINVYNAYTLKFIIEEYPVESINDLHWGGLYLGTVLGTTVWDDDKIVINEMNLSLNNVEHDTLRKAIGDERVHFALVCASISCPNLRNEAYEGFKLDEQLDEEARKFFNDSTKNRFDQKSKTAYLSKILDWYDDDFGNNRREILEYVVRHLREDLAKEIIANIDEWQIDYFDYNWNLNDSNLESQN
ncbi:MAG: DUF547 domain-containing protein [Ignavibacterium sp.]|nr:MAG: DUF547 domain-containing protein [Ignavibacterium sp.]